MVKQTYVWRQERRTKKSEFVARGSIGDQTLQFTDLTHVLARQGGGWVTHHIVTSWLEVVWEAGTILEYSNFIRRIPIGPLDVKLERTSSHEHLERSSMKMTHRPGDSETCQRYHVCFPTPTTFQIGYERRICQRGERVASQSGSRQLGLRSGR